MTDAWLVSAVTTIERMDENLCNLKEQVIKALTAPYIARCYKKGGGLSYYKIQGLSIAFDGQNWRMLSFEKI